MKLAFTAFDKAILAAVLLPVFAVVQAWLKGGTVVWPHDYIVAGVAGLVAGALVYLKGNKAA